MFVIWKDHPEYGYGEVISDELPLDSTFPEGSVTVYFSYRDTKARLTPEQYEQAEPEQPCSDAQEGQPCFIDDRKWPDVYEWSNLDPEWFDEDNEPNINEKYDVWVGLLVELGVHHAVIKFAGVDGSDCTLYSNSNRYRIKDENGKPTWEWNEAEFDGPVLTIRYLKSDWRSWSIKPVCVCSGCGDFVDQDYCRYPDEGSHLYEVWHDLCEGCADDNDTTHVEAVGDDAGDLYIGNVTCYTEDTSNRIDEFVSEFQWFEDKEDYEEYEVPIRHVEEMPQEYMYPNGVWIELPDTEYLWEKIFTAVDHLMGVCKPKTSYDVLPKPWWMKVVLKLRKWDYTFEQWFGKWLEKRRPKHPKGDVLFYKLGHWWYNVWWNRPQRWSHLLGTRHWKYWQEKLQRKSYVWFDRSMDLFIGLEARTRKAYSHYDHELWRAGVIDHDPALIGEWLRRPWLHDHRPKFTIIKVNDIFWIHQDDVPALAEFFVKLMVGVYDEYEVRQTDIRGIRRKVEELDMAWDDLVGVPFTPSIMREWLDERQVT